MIKITIFTPSYNRANLLERCYRSILAQNVKDIEWIIIDDGSSDETYEVVQQFILEKKILINYFYQNNSGKQAAWNVAVNKARGYFFIGLDSDDELIPNSLANLTQELDFIFKRDNIIGIRGIAISSINNKVKKSFYPKNKDGISSWFEEFSSRIFEERIDVFKTKILKEFLFPVNSKIKFIPEIWFYCKVSKYYKFLYINREILKYYDDKGRPRLSSSSLREHAIGHYLSRKAMLECIPFHIFIRNPLALIKTLIRFFQAKIICITERK